jgi:hypothetical protein
MTAAEEREVHADAWQILPWLANGRLSAGERDRLEEHVRQCACCAQELALQRRLCEALTEPDRVTYAPGPSFRKLLERIDGPASHKDARPVRLSGARVSASARSVSLWRPPGLAWAASFLVVFGIGSLGVVYHWSQPSYRTHTDATTATPNVLHVAFDRSLTIGEVEEMLGTNGARVVEGPGNTGIFGVTSVGIVAGQTSAASVSRQMRVLAARLRSDTRVRWVEPTSDDDPKVERVPPPKGP